MTSADRLVVDASAAIAMLRAEPEATAVARALAVGAADGSIIVPDIFWLEVQNVLVRRHHWDADAIVEAFRLLDVIGIETATLDRPILLLALDHMIGTGLTAHDAAYLALAETEGAMLVTLDEALASAAGTRAIVPGRHGTRELATPYATASVTWSRHGRYLAELRERAATA